MGCLRIKDGVTLEPMALGGALIVAALVRAAARLDFDLEITSGTDGVHSGPTDPHKRGEADDVHSHDFTTEQKTAILRVVMTYLGEWSIAMTGRAASAQFVETSGGFATELYFGFLETPDTPNEHFHFQVRRGQTVPPAAAGALHA